MLQFQWCVCCLVIGIADFLKKSLIKYLKTVPTHSLFFLTPLKGPERTGEASEEPASCQLQSAEIHL